MGLGGILMKSGLIYSPKPQCRVSDFLKMMRGRGSLCHLHIPYWYSRIRHHATWSQ